MMTLRLFLLASLVFAAGCSIPIPQATADPTRFYVLTSATPAVETAGARPLVHLRDVEVATYLRSRPMVVRRGDHEVEFREYARWGEPLELGLSRVLREELLARGAAAAVLTPGLRQAGVAYDYELKVRVLAAEGTTNGAIVFRAAWELTAAAANAEPVARGDFRPSDLRWDGTSEATLVGGLNAAVAALATEITAALPRK